MSIELLAEQVSALTEKLHGVGLEIYHLGSSIDGLKNSISRWEDTIKEKEHL